MLRNIDITLSYKSSSLDNITLYEPANLQLINKLIHTDLLKETSLNSFSSFKSEKKILEKYVNLIHNNKASVTYKKRAPFGRTIAEYGLGMQGMRKCIRHTIV
jgi:hypothetical protein